MATDRYIGRSLRRSEDTRTVLRALPTLLELVRRGDAAAVLSALDDLAQRWSNAGEEGAGTMDVALWDGLIAAALVPARPAQDVADLSDALRLDTAFARAALPAPDPAGVMAALTATPVLPAWHLPQPVPGSPADRGVRPVGVADLLVIEQRLLGYEQAQLSYVENVLRSEKKERTFRKLDRIFDSFTVSTESVEESERDLQTTSRSDLQTEVSETASQEASLSTGVAISAQYGPFVSADTSIDPPSAHRARPRHRCPSPTRRTSSTAR